MKYAAFIYPIFLMFLIGCTAAIKEPDGAKIHPTPEADDPFIPAEPYVTKCEDTYKLRFPVSGTLDRDTAYAWLQISKNDSVYLNSEPTSIVNSSFTTPKIYAYFKETQLPEGTYDLYIYLSDQESEVKWVAKRITASGPYKFTISYGTITTLMCISEKILLGDSVYFSVDSVPSVLTIEGYYWNIRPDRGGWYGNGFRFSIRDLGRRYSDKFVKLGDNLFFPLKLSRENSMDSVKWEITFIRDRDNGNPSDTEKALLYVDRPISLGSDYTAYDRDIILWSDSFAVPPQVVKAIIDKESNFNPNSYRYEMDFDFNTLQSAIYNNTDNSSAYYKHYFVADSARRGSPKGYGSYGNRLTQGDSVPHMINPYIIMRDYSLAPSITIRDINSDSLISARELCSLNTRWADPANDFTSQIILSSSYGLMQPLQVSLIDYAGYGHRDPQDLFIPANCIPWGTRHFSYIYYNVVRYPDYTWEQRLRAAIGKYNGGPGAEEYLGQFDIDIYNRYADSVIAKINLYKPR
jgi:hypothetical protein